MRRMVIKKNNIWIWKISAVVLAILNILVWIGDFSTDTSVTVGSQSDMLPVSVTVFDEVPLLVAPDGIEVPIGIVMPDTATVTATGDPTPKSPVSNESTNRPSVSVPIPDDVTLPVASDRVGVPVRISIPSIALDAAIEEVALTVDGSMGVPKHPLNAAWYALGPSPGEIGSAVIAGHVDWINGAGAVFANLRMVELGDNITIRDDKGVENIFVAREIRSYGAAADATDVFSSNDGRAHLNIITCSGIWDKNAQQYTERLVVFANKTTE